MLALAKVVRLRWEAWEGGGGDDGGVAVETKSLGTKVLEAARN